MKVEQEEGGLVAGTLKGLDLVENASDTRIPPKALAEELLISSEHAQFPLEINSPNRRHHFPAAFRANWLTASMK